MLPSSAPLFRPCSHHLPGCVVAFLTACLALLPLPLSASAPSDQPPPGEACSHFDAKARAHKQDLAGLLEADGHYTQILKAAEVAGLLPLLHSSGPLTAFLPNDDAFAKLPAATRADFFARPQVLKTVLRHHILRTYVPLRQVRRLRNALTSAGTLVRIDTGIESVRIGGARVVQADQAASNGIVHGIDTVLIPSLPTPKKPKKPSEPRTRVTAQRSRPL